VIETERLLGEPITDAHAAALEALLGDPRVGATLGGTLDAAGVRGVIAFEREHWDANGFGYWAWRERAGGAVVARGGLHRTRVGGRDEVEVGWVVAPGHWGEGLATELGGAAIGVAFGSLGLPDLVAYTLPDNRASRRVMDKLGFEFERDVVHADAPHVLYRLAPGR
jgi:RimJ/RimL family protein N-acetyltransferase